MPVLAISTANCVIDPTYAIDEFFNQSKSIKINRLILEIDEQ